MDEETLFDEDIESIDGIEYQQTQDNDDDDDRNNQKKTKDDKSKSKSEEAYEKKFDDDGKYNKDYYKERGEQLRSERQEYKANNGFKEQKAEAKENLRDAKEKYRASKNGGGSNGGQASSPAPANALRDSGDKAKEGANNVKEAKKNVKEAKDALKNIKDKSKSGKLNPLRQAGNKLDSARSKAYSIRHPLKTAKKKAANKIFSPYYKAKNKAKNALKRGAKRALRKAPKTIAKTAKATAKGAKAAAQGLVELVKLAVEFWPITLGLVLAGFFLALAVYASGLGTEDEMTISSSYSYTINGVELSDLDVKIVDSDGKELSTIGFEKFIIGATLATFGSADKALENPEAFKAAQISLRTYLLHSGISPENVLTIRNDSMLYWDYNQDVYKLEDNTKYGFEVEKDDFGAVIWHEKLDGIKIKQIEELSLSVVGNYIESGFDKANPLTEANIDQLITYQAEGNDATDIIVARYGSSTQINTGKTDGTFSISGEAGDYSTWKQKDPRWANVILGDSKSENMGNYGCFVTSIAMAIADAGGKTTIDDFNPGTFAIALKQNHAFSDGGGLNSSKIPSVVPSFRIARVDIANNSKDYKIGVIKKAVESGCKIVMQVKSGGIGDTHFVTLDPYTSAANGWKTLAIWDPASPKSNSTWEGTYYGRLPYYECIKVN